MKTLTLKKETIKSIKTNVKAGLFRQVSQLCLVTSLNPNLPPVGGSPA